MPLATGSRLGPYEIISSLGAGGMGVVYRARDTRLDRVVAIVAFQQRRFTIARSADGCKRLLGPPLYSTQLENCGFSLLIELDDVVVTASQELCDVFCGAVAEPNPNELRRGPSQEGKSMKILVLADHQAAVLTRQVPDGRICRPALTQSANV